MAHVLATDREGPFAAASDFLSEARLRENLIGLTRIPSPTGLERAAAQFAHDRLRAAGVACRLQPMGDHSANVAARLPGTGDGPSVLLYAPIDTHLDGTEEDLPWAGLRLRPDMMTDVEERDGFVIGLGASNPKGMAAAMLEVMLALNESRVPLKGDVILGLAGGGMPVIAGHREGRGLGDGAYHLLTRGAYADFAIVIKPGSGVYFEEPGLCWFRITVEGSLGYSGMPRGRPGFRDSIGPAAELILELERWLPRYTIENTSGQIAPHARIAAIRAGWPDKVAFPSATTEIYLDIRCSPRSSPARVHHQLSDALRTIGARTPGLSLECQMIASYPGASTEADNWIVRSGIRAWEAVEGMEHVSPPPSGGQTDISLIRNLGIPTARIGWPSTPAHAPPEFTDGLGGMGVASPSDLIVASRKVLHTVIDTCSRERAEVGC